VAPGLTSVPAQRPARAGQLPDSAPSPVAERDAESEGETSVDPATAVAVASFVPSAVMAAPLPGHATVGSLAGYDGGTGKASFDAFTEARLWGPVSVRGAAVYTPRTKTLRPALGVRLQTLRQGTHGIDAAVGVSYRPEGLTEPEGEIETVLAFGRRLENAYLLGNLTYGQDPEGRERDGEVLVAAQRRASARLWLGLDGHARFDLGSATTTLAAHAEPRFDLRAGPTATYVAGSVVLVASAGFSAVRFADQTTARGFSLLAGGGTTF